MKSSHPHSHSIESINRAFIVGIALNAVFVVVEGVWGLLSGSLALLSDAGHNLSDVFSLVLALIAFKLLEVKPSERFTYGLKKSTILVSLLNAVIILIAMGAIGQEAIQRLGRPVELHGKTVAIVAAIGIVINSVTAFLFFRDKDRDLNIKGAYLHLAADALVSAGVVATGFLIILTKWYWLDSAISLVIIAVIFYGTWGLLKESLALSLAGTPKQIDMAQVRDTALGVDGVTAIHHIHVWAISTTQNALTAHIVVSKDKVSEASDIAGQIRHRLEHLGIHHCTLEVEPEGEDCDKPSCS